MLRADGYFKGVRNTDLYYQAWLPESGAKAALLFLHGLGSHSGRYANIVGALVPLGYAVYGFDQIGHGRSGGARGRIARFEDFTDSLAVYRRLIETWQPGKPCFLFGHSMGGLIAADYLLDRRSEFRGAILSAPAVKSAGEITPMSILLVRTLSALLPNTGILQLNPDFLSRDPEVVRSYRNDPLVRHGKTPARLAAELLKAMLRAADKAERITLPFLIVQGGADRIVNPDGARMLFDKAASADKALRIYEGLYHETFNEPERCRVLQDMEDWLEARI
jgi:acylglycerol lipase